MRALLIGLALLTSTACAPKRVETPLPPTTEESAEETGTATVTASGDKPVANVYGPGGLGTRSGTSSTPPPAPSAPTTHCPSSYKSERGACYPTQPELLEKMAACRSAKVEAVCAIYADAVMLTVEPLHLRYDAMPLDGGADSKDMRRMKRTLMAKTEAAMSLVGVYAGVMEVVGRGPNFVSPAIQAGAVLDHLSEGVRAFPAPPTLSPEQQALFARTLARQAEPLDQKALMFYVAGIEDAMKAGLDNPELTWARDRLATLKARQPVQ